MTFERENRTGHEGGFLWKMALDDRHHVQAPGRSLIFEPNASHNPHRAAELNFWVEEQVPRYYWYTEDPRTRPTRTSPPTFKLDTAEVKNSRAALVPSAAFEFICLRALARGEMLGESAASAVHSLFWQNFVEDDGGLAYLHKFATRDFANYYACQRLLRYIGHDDRQAAWEARTTIDDAMKDHDPALGERFSAQLTHNQNLVDAIEAIRMTNEPEDVQLGHVRRLVELNATRTDHVITRIVEVTRDKQALLGLRACRRIERDSMFFAACDAYVLANPNGKGLSKMLKAQCPAPKLRWPRSQYDEEVSEVEDDVDVDVAEDEETEHAA